MFLGVIWCVNGNESDSLEQSHQNKRKHVKAFTPQRKKINTTAICQSVGSSDILSAVCCDPVSLAGNQQSSEN